MCRTHSRTWAKTAGPRALFGPPELGRNPRGRRLRDLLLAAYARHLDDDVDRERAALLRAAGLDIASTSRPDPA